MSRTPNAATVAVRAGIDTVLRLKIKSWKQVPESELLEAEAEKA